MEELFAERFPSIRWAPKVFVYSGVGLGWVLILALMSAPALFRWVLHALPEWLFIVSVAGALYLIPGLAMLQWLWPDVSLWWPERTALAWGVGVALPPLLLEIAYQLYLPWNSWTTLAYLVLAVLLLFIGQLRGGGESPRFLWSSLARALRVQQSAAQGERVRPHGFEAPAWYTLLLLGLLGVALLVRLYVVQELPVGMLGDSYQHTMMAQLLVDHSGLFSSWEPYAPLATFTYHYGFHANVAFFHWLTGIPVTRAVLYIGQILNAATIAVAYALTVWLTRDRAAGLWAALLTGFFNTQPAYYVNWGRYTQLAGHVVLPVVVLAWMEALEIERADWRRLLLAAITTACLMLTHYIVTIFAALFVLVYLLALLVRTPGWQVARRIATRGVLINGLALLFAAPWLVNTVSGYLLRNVAHFVNGQVGAQRVAEYAALPSPVPFYIKELILVCAIGGLLFALGRREWRVALLAVWSLMLILAVQPWVLGLPGTGVVDYFTAYIALYVPIIPLAAYMLGLAQARLAAWRPKLVAVTFVGALLVISSWGVYWQQQIVDGSHQLFTAADAQAMAWIREQTPADGRFLVNSFPAYGGSLVAGTDGGWWIPLLTGRKSSLPPLTYGSERAAQPNYWQQVNQLAETLRGHPLSDPRPVQIDLTTPAALQALRTAGIDYIYSGAHPVPGPDRADRIKVSKLLAHPEIFRLVYNHNKVMIFKFEGAP